MMGSFLSRFRRGVFKGVLALIPIIITYLTVKFVYEAIDQRVMGWVDAFIPFVIPGLGIAILLVGLYVLGEVTSTILVGRGIELFERIISKIPLVKTTYTLGKQISSTFALDQDQAFKKSVFLYYLSEHSFVLGFVTGDIVCASTGQMFYKVFVPTPPNPTTGYVVIAPKDKTIDTGWTVEESLKAVISVGIISPPTFGRAS
jgi:uncharacterized membrane protein